MFEMYFVGQIRRFRYGGLDRFGKIGRFGSKSSSGYSEKCSPRVLDVCAN